MHGISRLMNHATLTMDARVRCSPVDLYSIGPYNPSFWVGEIPADVGTFYDRPDCGVARSQLRELRRHHFVAVLVRLQCADVRSFAERRCSAECGDCSTLAIRIYLRCPNFTMVDHFAPEVPRWGQEYPLDEEVWLTPDDVALGYDTVVRRAQAWMEHTAYANRVECMATYLRPGLDSALS